MTAEATAEGIITKVDAEGITTEADADVAATDKYVNRNLFQTQFNLSY